MTTVIGIGNRDRGDDAAGMLVTDAIRSAGKPGIRVVQVHGDPLLALDGVHPADRVVIVDAAGPAGHPGRVHRMVAAEMQGVASYRGRSTHGLGAGEVVRLGLALGSLSRETVVYGIEGGDFKLGHGPSGAVRQAIRDVVARILEDTA